MIARILALGMLIVSSLAMHAQQEVLVAPMAGVTFTSADFRQLGPLVLPERATGLSSSASWFIGARLAYRLPLSTQLSILPSAAWTTTRSVVTATEPTTFAIQGKTVAGTFTHTYTFTTQALEGGMEARYVVAPMLHVSVGGGAMFLTSMSGVQNTAITDPPGVTFLNGSSNIDVASGDVPERRSVVPFITASAIVPMTISSVNVDAELGFRSTLGSMVTNGTLTTSALFARFAIRFDLEDAPPPSLPSRSHGNTSTSAVQPALQFPAVLPPAATLATTSLAPAVYTMCTVAFKQKDGRVTEKGVVRIDRALMLSLDHGPDAPATVRTDTILRADPPVVVVRPVVSSDDSIASWRLRIRIADSTLVERTGTGAPPAEIEWDCASAGTSLFSLLVHDSAVAVLDAVGHQGGTAISAPSTIRLVEGRNNAALDTTRVHAAIWGFDVNTSDLPSWSRPTITFLRALARTATAVTVYGSADGDGERTANERIAELRGRKVATALGVTAAGIQTDPIPPTPTVRNDRDRRVRIVMKR